MKAGGSGISDVGLKLTENRGNVALALFKERAEKEEAAELGTMMTPPFPGGGSPNPVSASGQANGVSAHWPTVIACEATR